MIYEELLKKMELVLSQTRVIASINPSSIDATIYGVYQRAYNKIITTGSVKDVRIRGYCRPYADSHGYEAPLLYQLSEAENLLAKEQANELEENK